MKLIPVMQLVGESNRMFANKLDIFSMLSDGGISYKTIERLYSYDEDINMVHNLRALLLKRKELTNSEATDDCTACSIIHLH